MKPKSALMHANPPASGMTGLPARMSGHRKMLLGVAALAGMFLSGCAVYPVRPYADDPGLPYLPYSGPYYGSYGPYPLDLSYGGLYRGGHHFAGDSFGHPRPPGFARGGFAPGGPPLGGGGPRGGPPPGGGGRGPGGGGHGPGGHGGRR